jgi:hypothetical protein
VTAFLTEVTWVREEATVAEAACVATMLAIAPLSMLRMQRTRLP